MEDGKNQHPKDLEISNSIGVFAIFKIPLFLKKITVLKNSMLYIVAISQKKICEMATTA